MKTSLLVIFIAACGALTFCAASSNAAPPSAQSQLDFVQLWTRIQTLKQSNSDISGEIYQRFFDLEQQLYPERISRDGRGSLDQGTDGCPGYPIVQPGEGPFDYVDYGQTYNFNNDCTIPTCRAGKDVFYTLTITHQDSLQITTCGSGFDTYLCIFNGACCEPDAAVFSNDDSNICGPNSVRSGIRGCFQPGTYYIVVDGFNGTSQGHYQLNVQSLAGGTCGQNPHVDCPADYDYHAEGPDEGVCDYGTAMNCPARYCGEIGGLGDLDVYTFTLASCHIVTLSAWGNDTPGHSGSGLGLDPVLNLYSNHCESPIYTNDDVIGNPPDILGHDSRITTLCLRPATYWVELGGDATSGLYEFAYDCEPCESSPPLGDVSRDDSNPGNPCLNWTPQSGATTYYVWRFVASGPWDLIATTPNTSYCDSSNPPSGTQYLVFGDPCGVPSE